MHSYVGKSSRYDRRNATGVAFRSVTKHRLKPVGICAFRVGELTISHPHPEVKQEFFGQEWVCDSLPSRAKPARCPFARLTRADCVRILHEHKRLLENMKFSGAFPVHIMPFRLARQLSLIAQILLSEPSTYLIL